MILTFLLSSLLLASNPQTDGDSTKTTFQSSRAWNAKIDARPDAVLLYGFGNFRQRMATWKDNDYDVKFMTGIAWGGYDEYFSGKWDGVPHRDEGQMADSGVLVSHDHEGKVPYIVPTMNYLAYMKENVRKIIDCGITDIYLEEPEFFARSGYSESFKREWEQYYGFPWRAQHLSPENTYLSNKLKYHLYYRALNEIFSDAKQYGKQLGKEIKCYVPTHSLVNYSIWNIVSPEASLASLPCVDGYIGQVWTGTSRSPIVYDGEYRSRIFENAYLEYGALKSMTEPTGRKVYFLTDPIEDASVDWEDYKRNYEATFAAELMFPTIDNFEIMPWPERIFMGKYRKSADDPTMDYIPPFYATQIQIMVNSLMTMPKAENSLSGTKGLGVLMGNSIMFQRKPDGCNGEDERLSDFYGLAMPFVKRGVPVEIVHMENLGYETALKDIKILMMSYVNQKPMDSLCHHYLKDWVKQGGILVYCSRDDDPFQSVQEWWNKADVKYDTPSDHLFTLMGIKTKPESGTYRYGDGHVVVIRENPREFVLKNHGYDGFVKTIKSLYDKYAGTMTFSNHMILDRDIYRIAAVMDESVSNKPLILKGNFIDLFSSELPIIKEKTVKPAQQAYLVDLDKVDKSRPAVIATAARIYDEKQNGRDYSFKAVGPEGVHAVTRMSLPDKPTSVKIDGMETFEKSSWDEATHTYIIHYTSSPKGTFVVVSV